MLSDPGPLYAVRKIGNRVRTLQKSRISIKWIKSTQQQQILSHLLFPHHPQAMEYSRCRARLLLIKPMVKLPSSSGCIWKNQAMFLPSSLSFYPECLGGWRQMGSWMGPSLLPPPIILLQVLKDIYTPKLLIPLPLSLLLLLPFFISSQWIFCNQWAHLSSDRSPPHGKQWLCKNCSFYQCEWLISYLISFRLRSHSHHQKLDNVLRL